VVVHQKNVRDHYLPEVVDSVSLMSVVAGILFIHRKDSLKKVVLED